MTTIGPLTDSLSYQNKCKDSNVQICYCTLPPLPHTHHTTPTHTPHTTTHTHTHTHTQDDLVEHYQKHGSFPEKQVNMPKRPYTDLVVMMWLAMVGVPALLSGLYLAWVGNWLVLAIIVAAVVLGTCILYTYWYAIYLYGSIVLLEICLFRCSLFDCLTCTRCNNTINYI